MIPIKNPFPVILSEAKNLVFKKGGTINVEGTNCR